MVHSHSLKNHKQLWSWKREKKTSNLLGTKTSASLLSACGSLCEAHKIGEILSLIPYILPIIWLSKWITSWLSKVLAIKKEFRRSSGYITTGVAKTKVQNNTEHSYILLYAIRYYYKNYYNEVLG